MYLQVISLCIFRYVPSQTSLCVDIQQLLCAGKVSSAVAAIKQSYPTLLDSKPELHFRLLCLQFVEMVRRVDSGRADVSVTPYQPTSASRDTDSELNCTGVSNARGLVLPSPDWESSTTTTPVHAANGVHRISDGETEMSTSSAHLAGDDATVREAVSEPMDTDEEVCVDGDEPLEQTMTMAESLRRTSPQKPVSMQASESVIGSCSKSNTVATETHPTNGHTAMESGGQGQLLPGFSLPFPPSLPLSLPLSLPPSLPPSLPLSLPPSSLRPAVCLSIYLLSLIQGHAVS